MNNPLTMAVMAAGGRTTAPAGPATVVQERWARTFNASTTVGNTVLWVCYNNGAQSVPSGAGWVEVATRTAGSWRITVWALPVTSPFTTFGATNTGTIENDRVYEINGLDNAALGTPLSVHTNAAGGAVPSTSFTGITDPYAFGLFVLGTDGSGWGGAADLYDWVSGLDIFIHAYTNDLYNQDQSMSGGGVSSGAIAVISVAFQSG